jgi:hypothetical protein
MLEKFTDDTQGGEWSCEQACREAEIGTALSLGAVAPDHQQHVIRGRVMTREIDVECLEVDGRWYWICTCAECGGPTSESDEVDLDARRPHGPFKSHRAAYKDVKAQAEGRITKAQRRWMRKYAKAYLAEHPELLPPPPAPAKQRRSARKPVQLGDVVKVQAFQNTITGLHYWFEIPEGQTLGNQVPPDVTVHGPFKTEKEVEIDQLLVLGISEVIHGGTWDPAWDRPQ